MVIKVDVALIPRVTLICGLTNEGRFNDITSPVVCFIAQHKQHTIRVIQNMHNCPADDVVKLSEAGRTWTRNHLT